MAAAPPKYLGQRIRRREDPRLITGSSTYVDDLNLPGTLYLAILRSPHAHARIHTVKTERARALAGVMAIVTAADIASAFSGPLPLEVDMSLFPGANTPERWPLASDKVRYVGDPIVAVAATERYLAEDALGSVRGGAGSRCAGREYRADTPSPVSAM